MAFGQGKVNIRIRNWLVAILPQEACQVMLAEGGSTANQFFIMRSIVNSLARRASEGIYAKSLASASG